MNQINKSILCKVDLEKENGLKLPHFLEVLEGGKGCKPLPAGDQVPKFNTVAGEISQSEVVDNVVNLATGFGVKSFDDVIGGVNRISTAVSAYDVFYTDFQIKGNNADSNTSDGTNIDVKELPNRKLHENHY